MFDFINDERMPLIFRREKKDEDKMQKEMHYEQGAQERNLLSRISSWLWEFH